jgi:hypothetical protein
MIGTASESKSQPSPTSMCPRSSIYRPPIRRSIRHVVYVLITVIGGCEPDSAEAIMKRSLAATGEASRR